jgi:hypothetical protein
MEPQNPPGMILYPVVRVEFKEALERATLIALIEDLRLVAATCTRMKEMIDTESKDDLTLQSLWIAALTRYARCFNIGKRHYQVKEDIFDDAGDLKLAHHEQMAIRNKHFAHSVNSFEVQMAGAVLQPPELGPKEALGLQIMISSLFLPQKSDAQTLGVLATFLGKKLVEVAASGEKNVLALLKEMDIEELYKREPLQYVHQNVDPDKARPMDGTQ